MAFCKWYNKDTRDVSEHEAEACEEAGMECGSCNMNDFNDDEEETDNE